MAGVSATSTGDAGAAFSSPRAMRVFALNALPFLVSAALIAGMRFERRHLDGAAPYRARDVVNFAPIFEGVQ